MEHPVQVGECVGCSICIRECPVSVMTLTTVDGPVELAPRQGPIHRPAATAGSGWIPLSAVTRELLKPTKVSPFGALMGWRTGGHGTGPGPRPTPPPRGSLPGRLSGGHRCRPLRRADRRGSVR